MVFKKRIALVANTSWYLYNLRLSVITSLQKANIHVTVIAPRDGYTAKLLAADCHFIPLKIHNKGVNPVKDGLLMLRLLRIFQKNSFDYIFTYTIKPNIYATIAAHICQKKTITILSGRGYSFFQAGWLSNTVQQLYKIAATYSHQFWFVNPDDFDFFIKKNLVALNKCRLLAGEGVNVHYFSPKKTCKKDPNSVTFLFSGRLLWSKGIGYYVNAAKAIRQKYPSARFQILGYFGVQNPDAITEQQIEQWQVEGNIQYLGFTSDVRPFLAKADCVILPSFYGEGTPRSLLEAASMEIPIITTDNVGCREVVEHGVNGFLCQPKEVDSLIQAIETFLDLTVLDRQKMGKSGRKMVKERFDEQLVIRQYLELVGEQQSLPKKLKTYIKMQVNFLKCAND